MVAVKPQCTLSIFQRLPCSPARESRRQRDWQTFMFAVLRCCLATRTETDRQRGREKEGEKERSKTPASKKSPHVLDQQLFCIATKALDDKAAKGNRVKRSCTLNTSQLGSHGAKMYRLKWACQGTPGYSRPLIEEQGNTNTMPPPMCTRGKEIQLCRTLMLIQVLLLVHLKHVFLQHGPVLPCSEGVYIKHNPGSVLQWPETSLKCNMLVDFCLIWNQVEDVSHWCCNYNVTVLS